MEYPIHVHDIGVSDPHVLADKKTGKYYMTSSGFTLKGKSTRRMGTIVALVSEDLIHWSEPVTIFDCNGTDYWGKMGYPATEMHCIGGKYYLSGTAGAPGFTRKSMILVADDPLGPFTWITNTPYSPAGWQTIDTTIYMDKTNHPWIVFSHEWYQVSDGQMAAIPLSDDFKEPIGGPMILFRASDAVWGDDQIWSRTDGGGVTDGPWMFRLDNGDLVMLWSTRSRTGYAMGYAKSNSGEIWGPWIQRPFPVYAHDGGHSMLFRKFDGTLILSMHINDRGPKMLVMFEMEERNGELYTVNEITGNWMSYMGGSALPYRSTTLCKDEPAFTTLSPIGVDPKKA